MLGGYINLVEKKLLRVKEFSKCCENGISCLQNGISCLGCSNSTMKLGIFTQFRDNKYNKTYLYSAYAFQC